MHCRCGERATFIPVMTIIVVAAAMFAKLLILTHNQPPTIKLYLLLLIAMTPCAWERLLWSCNDQVVFCRRNSNDSGKRKRQKRNHTSPTKDAKDGQTANAATDAAMANQHDAANKSPVERAARRSHRRKATSPSSPSSFLSMDAAEADQPNSADADSLEANRPKRSRRQAPCPPAKRPQECNAEENAKLPQQAHAVASAHGINAEGRTVHAPSAACAPGKSIDVEHSDARHVQGVAEVMSAGVALEGAPAGSRARGRSRRGPPGRQAGIARRGARKRQPAQDRNSPSSSSGLPPPIPVSPISQGTSPPASPALHDPVQAQTGECISPCDLERLAYFSAQPQLVHEQLSSAVTGGASNVAGLPLPLVHPQKGNRGRRTFVRKGTALY